MLLYNGDFIPEQELRLPLTNRAFQYNDGFFETIMIVDGRIRFWQEHLDRMQIAAKALNILIPGEFKQTAFEDKLLHLADRNNASVYGRLKLKVWRGGAGLYTPETNTAEWLITLQPASAPPDTLEHVGICTSVRTNFSPLSCFKGPNSLLYVMAGMEKKERGFDDVILLSRQNLISELSSSNIFWYQNGIVYTPSLETGCVNGILRRNIMRWSAEEGIKTREAFFDVDAILQADAVFSANVTGIKEIKNLIGFKLKQETEIVSLFRHKLQGS